jgi:homoserine dehydrogenase
LLIFAKAALGLRSSLADVSVQGITHITSEMIQQAKLHNQIYKLIGSVHRIQKDTFKLTVEPVLVHPTSFLGLCNGWEMGLEMKRYVNFLFS